MPRSGPIARLDVEAFRLIQGLVNEHSGIHLPNESLAMVERKLADRVAALQLADYAEYYQHLRYHPQRRLEIERALEALTTNETYFFREMPQLRAFENEVLPALAHSARARRTLTIWSAGCSTGEEVYSLAILVAQETPVERWLAERDPARRAKLAAEIKGSPAEVEAELRKLPRRAADVPKGQVVRKRLKAEHPLAVEYEYVLSVPAAYAPDRPWRILVDLHGQTGTGEDALKRWKAEAASGSVISSGARIAASSMPIAAPCAWNGSIACAASPMRPTPPSDHTAASTVSTIQ